MYNRGSKMLVFCIILLIISTGCIKSKPVPSEPDICSIMDMSGHEYITVIANQDIIPDRTAFTWKIIQKIKDNDFPSIDFCYDDKGYPSELSVTIYLGESDIQSHTPAYSFDYRPEPWEPDLNIIDNPDKYTLTLTPAA